jgi:GAF domain-containing protein
MRAMQAPAPLDLPALESALTGFRRVYGTDLGNIQLLDMDGSNALLSVVVQHGFTQEFLDHFAVVSAVDDSACARALRLGRTVVIEDTETDAGFAPHRDIARAAGYRAVVSTPVATRWGHNVGIMSAHFRAPVLLGADLIREGEALALALAHKILVAAHGA